MSADPLPTAEPQRPSPFGGGLTVRCAAGGEWHVRDELADHLLGSAGLRIAEWTSAGLAATVKHGPHRTVWRVSLPAGVFYAKRYRIDGPRSWLQNNLRPCRAWREATANARVRAAGLATAEPVAVGRTLVGPFTADNWFVTREVPNVVPLDERLQGPGARVQGQVIDGVAELTAGLHRHGLYHADYHAGNLLVGADGMRPALIDLHPLRAARLTRRRRWTMLGMLAASLATVTTAADRRRFFETYAASLGSDDDPAAAAAFCEAEVRRRQVKADRRWRGGNRRLLILDTKTVACRGVAELGRETLIRWRDDLIAGRATDTPGCVVRRLPSMLRFAASPARLAWELGHALLRRGLPTARPLLFVADDDGGGTVVTEPAAGTPLVSAQRLSRRTLARLGSLLRRLHDAGFDAPPAAFAVEAARPFVAEPERIVPRRMTRGRRRTSLADLLENVPESDRRPTIRGYVGLNKDLNGFSCLETPGVPCRVSLGRRRAAAAILLATVLPAAVAGCKTIPPQPVVALPAKHSVRADHLVVVSDFKLAKDHPLLDDLIDMRKVVTRELRLPEPRRDVTVYVFAGEEPYRRYLDTVHPGLPPRRAYFVGTKSELAVYTYWGDRIQEDLRHEYTHGLLHASLDRVPLWLDEGLAEYFEVAGEPGGMNGDYPQQLAAAMSHGWRPDIGRLERLEEFSQMRRIDYQESWAWVHYMLHETPETRDSLISYLHGLRDASPASPVLSEQLAAVEPAFMPRFLGYVANLNATGGAVIRASL